MNHIIIYHYRLAMGPRGVQVAYALNKEDAETKINNLRETGKIEKIELHETKCLARWEKP